MGVEEVQKINTLAKELLKHHIASSSEDAFARAEVMVRGESPKETREDEVNRELRVMGLNINGIYNEMVGMQKELSSLKDEVSILRRKVDAFQASPAQDVHQQPSQSQPQPAQQAQQTQPQHHADKDNGQHSAQAARPMDATRPRTGDYETKDVAIEKFFYYGTGKKG